MQHHANDYTYMPSQILAAYTALLATQLTAPQPANNANKLRGTTAKSTLSALNSFLRADLRTDMQLLKDAHEAAY